MLKLSVKLFDMLRKLAKNIGLLTYLECNVVIMAKRISLTDFIKHGCQRRFGLMLQRFAR